MRDTTQITETNYISKRGSKILVRIEGYNDLLMRGKRKCPMHQCLMRVVRIRAFKPDGKPLYPRPLWLTITGKRRMELSLIEIWQAFSQRYDIEHYFRFGKQRLLMDAYQTPIVEHEESWWQFTMLAYVQLFLAAPLAKLLPRPWESKSKSESTTIASPSATVRDFERIIRQIGTPALSPKTRGFSSGTPPGRTLAPRERIPLIIKAKKKPKKLVFLQPSPA